MASSRKGQNAELGDVDGLRLALEQLKDTEVADADPAAGQRAGQLIARAVLDPGYPVLWLARDFRVWGSPVVVFSPGDGPAKRRPD
jgi:hypothetical protein